MNMYLMRSLSLSLFYISYEFLQENIVFFFFRFFL